MSLSSTLNIVNSSFNAIGVQSSTIASNVANANTAGYSREIAAPVADPYSGVEIGSVTREANAALAIQVNAATSESAAQSAIANGLATLAQTVDDSTASTTTTGAQQNGDSPAAMIANLQSALATYQANPSSQSSANAAVAAASNLAGSLNAGAAAVSAVRTQADQGVAQAVNQVNTLLQQFQTVNNSVTSGLASGGNVSALEDQRDQILTRISQQIGVTATTNGNGSMSIYTDSGVTLFDDAPYALTFSPSGQLGPNQPGGQVYVNGAAITGPHSNMPIQSGAVAGLISLRDTIAPQYQSQLDQITGALVTAFQETDQSAANPGLPPEPGLFTVSGATSVPASSSWSGLANVVEVNPNVDPAQGGNALLLRDGGVSDTANADYTYNVSGDASYTGRLQQLSAALTAPTSFAAGAGIGATGTLSSYAAGSASWLQAQNQQASTNAAYQSSLLTQSQSALSNATGVNLDAELTNMLTIENSYTASAKLLTTVNSMLQALLNAA